MKMNLIEKLRDLIGVMNQPFKNKPFRYQRFNVGDAVEFYNDSEGYWDTGVISSTRTEGMYTVRNPDSDYFVVGWQDMKRTY